VESELAVGKQSECNMSRSLDTRMGNPRGWRLRFHRVVAEDLDWCKDLSERRRDIAMQAPGDKVLVLVLAMVMETEKVTVKETAQAKLHKKLLE
jgi:hypothetical protein